MDQRKDFERGLIDELFRRLGKFGQRPDSIEEGERPDFMFALQNTRVGLEVTRSVYQELARAVRIQATGYPNEAMIITSLKDGPRRRSNSEISADAFSLSDEPVWQSCEDEMCDWQDKIALALEAKRERLNRPGFRLFEKNWLLIYDHPGLSNDPLTFNEAPKLVSRVFSTPSNHRLDFDTVFIVSGRYLFRWQDRQAAWHHEGAQEQQGAS
jgi:hypothetical protein